MCIMVHPLRVLHGVTLERLVQVLTRSRGLLLSLIRHTTPTGGGRREGISAICDSESLISLMVPLIAPICHPPYASS